MLRSMSPTDSDPGTARAKDGPGKDGPGKDGPQDRPQDRPGKDGPQDGPGKDGPQDGPGHGSRSGVKLLAAVVLIGLRTAQPEGALQGPGRGGGSRC